MAVQLVFSAAATAELARLKADVSLAGRLKAVRKALAFLENNPRHPGLNTHKFEGQKCPHKKDLFEAYAENNRPGAYRIFFCYVPDVESTVLIVDITVHP